MAEIEFSAKDYPGFASAGLDLCVEGRPGKPSGNFNRRVEVYLGYTEDSHVNLTHHEWGITLHGGPKLRAKYLEAKPSFGSGENFKPEALIRFIEREILRHVGSSRGALRRLIRAARNEGREEGREEAKAEIREALGVASLDWTGGNP